MCPTANPSLGNSLLPESDRMVFSSEEERPVHGTPWKVLIVDDDASVQDITRMVLSGFTFDGKPLELLEASSGHQAVALMRETPDVAVVFMDVVMESEHSGLEAIEAIREDLQNTRVRIVVKTGQPGQAPEHWVCTNYGINDYREKSMLTAQRLKAVLHMRLADYQTMAQ